MSTRSARSAWSETSSRAPGGKSRVRERPLPKNWAIQGLVYLTGRNPNKVKSLKVYQTTWSDDASDTSSNNSFWSGYSGSSGRQPKNEIYFLETRGMYYYGDTWDENPRALPVKRRKPKTKRAPPRKGGGKRHNTSSEDESDSESSTSDASLGDYGDMPGVGGFPPGMMPGMHGGPPPGPFMYGPPQQATVPPRPMTGFAPPPPPHPPPRGGIPPQQGFMPGRGGVQVFGMDP